MGSESDPDVREQLVRLHGRMAALSEAIRVIAEESAKVAAVGAPGEDAGPAERLAGAEGLAAASVEAVRACAGRINALFHAASAEFEVVKSRLSPGRSYSTH